MKRDNREKNQDEAFLKTNGRTQDEEDAGRSVMLGRLMLALVLVGIAAVIWFNR